MNDSKTSLNIVHICPFYSPCTGGVAGVALNISEELVQRGHNVTVLTTNRNIDGSILENIKNDEIINGVIIKRFKSILKIGYMHYCPDLITYLKHNNFDIIHCHSYRHPNVQLSISIGKSKNIPTILHDHGSLNEIGNTPKFKALIYKIYDLTFGKLLLRNVTRIITLTNSGKNSYIKMGVDRNKINIIPNSAKISNLSDNILPDVIQKYGLSDKTVIIFIGFLDTIKNPGLLIKAMPHIIKKIPNAFLLLIGPDMGIRKEIELLINSNNLHKNCQLLGSVYGPEKDAFLECSKLLVLPSNREGFPLVLLEAMMHGKPVVATKTIGAMEIVKNGETGFLVEINDIHGMAEAVIKILSNPGMITNMGLHAKMESRKYTTNEIINRVEELYYDIYSQIK